MAAIASGTAAVALLHALRPDRPPASSRLSEYATGDHGWIMAAAFVSMGVGVLAFAAALVAARTGRLARVAGAVAAAAGVGLVLSAMFPTGVSAAAEVMHSRASTVATAGLAAVAGVWSLASPVAADRHASSRLLGAGVVLAVAVSPSLHTTRWSGLGQRVVWILLVVWLVAAVRALRPTGE